MSPKHVRKAHVVHSSGNDDPIFCAATFDTYYNMRPPVGHSGQTYH